MDNNNLTLAQAQVKFVDGYKISHKYFIYCEFVQLNSDKEMVDENGTILDKWDFWKSKNTDQFKDGWFVRE